MKKTIKNKIAALGMIMVGLVPALLDGDATVLVFAGLFAIPLFFAKEDVFN